MYLITGASGFVGSRLVSALKKSNNEVRLMSRTKIHGFESIVCDFKSQKIPEGIFNGVDTVFHLAGFAHDLGSSNKLKNYYQEINFEATKRLAEQASQSGVKKFIFLSSVKAGGVALTNKLLNETDQNTPRDIYGKSKRDAELEVLNISKNCSMDVTIIRSSLVYGPGMKGNLKIMLNGIKRGWFPPLPETGNQRSLVHIDDLVRALIFVSKDKRANDEIFILTDGNSYSSRDIYDSMCTVLDKKIPNWSAPLIFFKIFSILSNENQYKVNKIFSDENYSSNKINSLGFETTRTLLEMNETSF